MGATTPILGLPYPLGTDRVMDGDDAIKALAERIEVLFNPAPGVVPSLEVNIGPPTAPWPELRIYKMGKLCVMFGAQNYTVAGAANVGIAMTTALPASVLPVGQVGGGANYFGGGPAVFTLSTTGVLTTYGPSIPANTPIAVNAAWVTTA